MHGSNPADRSLLRAHRILRPGFGTEAAVYGTILVSGLVAVSSAHGETSFQVLATVVATVLVFWGAHVYAGAVANYGVIDGHDVGVGEAFLRSLRRSFGMLGSALVPSVILLLGTTRVIPDAVANEVALWAGVVVLALLGYVAFLQRGSPFLGRLLGAAVTASFGVAFVVLKALVH